MDPNFPFHPGVEYFYNNYPQTHPPPPHQQNPYQPQQPQPQPPQLQQQFQQSLQSQPLSQPQPRHHPPLPQPHHPSQLQSQQPTSFYSQSYPQSLPQNYDQFFYNQDQTYQPQPQQLAQSFYQSPAPAQSPQHLHQTLPQTLPQALPQALPQSFQQLTPQVLIPPRQHPSPSLPQHQPRHPTQPSYQPQIHQTQAQFPSPSSLEPAKIPKPAKAAKPEKSTRPATAGPLPSLPQDRSEYRPTSNVVVNVPKPMVAPARSFEKSKVQAPPIVVEIPQEPQQSHSRPLQPVELNSTPKQPATKFPYPRDSPLQSDEPEPDYPTLLCVLADDYLEAARKQPALTETYYTLIATALGCLESVLANFKLPPVREAQVCLRYAQILYEETENYDEAETALTKSIELCERNKLIDLKYEMQLLLAKVLYESKPKAALRDMQRMIDDIEAYHHTAWLYIYRFQLAMFSLASSAPGEVHSSTVQLEKLSTLARNTSDSAILAFAATVEALLHLSSSNHDAITATQSALAKARALQLNPDVESNPQMTILMEFIELACSVRDCNIAQSEVKRKIMHDVLYKSIGHSNWRDDGLIYIPISKRAIANIQLQGTGHVIERNGRYFLTFSWLGKEEIEAMGFLFSADSVAYKNGADGGKAEKFAEAGLSLVRSWKKPALGSGYRQSESAYVFQRLLEAQLLVLLSFMECSKGLWEAAKKHVAEARAISNDVGETFPVNLNSSLLYLDGAIQQGTGNLTAAFQIYQSPSLALGLPSSDTSKVSAQISNSHFADSDVTHNFRILAAMNSAFILQNPAHPQHHRLSALISNLDPVVQSCGNVYIQAHFSLLVSFMPTTGLTVKQYLRSAMEAGQKIGSAQTTAIALICMQDKLFKGVVEDQALKCAKAASHQARRSGDPLLMHMAATLEAQSLEVHGMASEASQLNADAQAKWNALPEAVRGVTGN